MVLQREELRLLSSELTPNHFAIYKISIVFFRALITFCIINRLFISNLSIFWSTTKLTICIV